MVKYLDQMETLELRKGQEPHDLLAIRLRLITKCVYEFHNKFAETHKDELGPLVNIKAKQL